MNTTRRFLQEHLVLNRKRALSLARALWLKFRRANKYRKGCVISFILHFLFGLGSAICAYGLLNGIALGLSFGALFALALALVWPLEIFVALLWLVLR